MNKTTVFPFFLILLLWTGCSTLPETHTYILPTPKVGDQVQQKASRTINIENIKLADFLDQQGLVVEEGKHRIVITRYHRWAESLEDGIRRYLTRSLSQTGGDFRISNLRKPGALTWDYQLDFEFDSFHSIRFDKTIASGRWVLRDYRSGEVVREAYFDLSTSVQPQDYESIIESLAHLLDQLAQEVSSGIEASLVSE
jgi:uncharacterized lipoprotein YmbA